jgi:hypothetical protein
MPVRRSWLSTAWASYHERSPYSEVEKKPQQVRDQQCDQRPKDGGHSTLPSVRVDIAETEKPDSDHDAGE